jgi:PEP-CTERM motif
MKRCLAISILALLTMSGAAHGTSIAFHFHGQVNSVSPELLGQFATRQIFAGVFGFNSETEDQSLSPDRGLYFDALGFGHVNVESDYSAVIFGGDILVSDNSPFGDDRYTVRAGENCGDGEISGPTVNGWELCGFDLHLFDLDSLAFDSDQLPLLPPDLADFAGYQFNTLRLIFGRTDTAHRPQVTVFFWPDQPGARLFIAEPATLALLGLGLLGLGLTRRKAN